MSFFDEFGGERNFNLVGKDDAMKAAQYQGSQRVRVIEKSLRSLGDGEILLNVDVCGICGTDVHIVEGTSRSSPPVILGHEFTGTVESFVATSTPVYGGTVAPVTDAVQVRLSEFSLHRPRQWGACGVACRLWQQLQLDAFRSQRLSASREGTDWKSLLQVLTIYRLLDPKA